MRPSVTRTPHGWLAFGLVAALLFAQALGLVHRVVHAPAAEPQGALFGEHEHGDAQCQLVDQHAAEPALLAALPPLPAPARLPLPALACPAGHALAFVAAYAARAPPGA